MNRSIIFVLTSLVSICCLQTVAPASADESNGVRTAADVPGVANHRPADKILGGQHRPAIVTEPAAAGVDPRPSTKGDQANIFGKLLSWPSTVAEAESPFTSPCADWFRFDIDDDGQIGTNSV